MIRLDITKALVSAGEVAAMENKVAAAQQALENGTCAGNYFLGWLHLPSSITAEFLTSIQECAQTLRENCDTVVVAGIGGSYLGARAIIEALGNSFQWLTNKGENPNILFAGNNIGEDYLYELTEYLKDKKFGVINISKSGTTTETALAFRLLKKQCEQQRGKEMARSEVELEKMRIEAVRAIGEAYAENQQPEVLIQQHYNQGNKENNQSDNQ